MINFIGSMILLVKCVCISCSVMSDSLRPHGLQPSRFLCPWNSPGKNTGVGCHFLLQGIFPTQGSNLGLLYCRQILYCLSHQGSPFVLIPNLLSLNILSNNNRRLPKTSLLYSNLSTSLLNQLTVPSTNAKKRISSTKLSKFHVKC